MIDSHEKQAEASVSILEELKELGKSIKELRGEISKIQKDNTDGFHFSSAHDELEAVVEAAAGATNKILDKVESIEKITPEFGERQYGVILDNITKIYEACGFQDLTGQRIRKVIHVIRTIENDLEDIFKHYANFIDAKNDPHMNAEQKEALNHRIIKELYNLNIKLRKTKQEVISGADGGLKKQQFNIAHDELEAVSKAAESATNTILTSAENLEKLKNFLEPDIKYEFIKYILVIYEACSFQDLIGQRVSKVMKALSLIEHALSKIFQRFEDVSQNENLQNYDWEHLENGPQLPNKALTQDLIDTIFNSVHV